MDAIKRNGGLLSIFRVEIDGAPQQKVDFLRTKRKTPEFSRKILRTNKQLSNETTVHLFRRALFIEKKTTNFVAYF